MNLNSICAAALTILLILTGCTGQQNNEIQTEFVENPTYGKWQDRNQPISFELDQSYGSSDEDDGVLFSNSFNIAGPVADSSGNIYIIESRQTKLISYDPQGNLRFMTGEEGKGPGDLQRPKGMAINGGSLFFDNVSGSRIDEYDLNGNFIQSMSLPSDITFGTIKGFLSNGLLVTSSYLLGEIGNKISVFDVSDSLRLVNSFDVNLLKDVETGGTVSAVADVSVIDSLIAVGNYRDYSISYYAVNGKKVRTVTRDFSKMVRPGIIKSQGEMRTLGNLKAPLQLDNGYLLTTLFWPTNISDPDEYTRKSRAGNPPGVRFANSMDLFRADGTLLYSWERNKLAHPQIGDIAYVDSDGNLYTKKDEPFPHINRYNITFKSSD